MAIKKSALFFFLLFAAVGLVFSGKISAATYTQQNCVDSNAICNTDLPADGDIAPNFDCGTQQGKQYKLESANSAGTNNPEYITNGVETCGPDTSNPNGYCCIPGTPVPSLPPHKGYDLGGACGQTSICYTGNYNSNNTAPGAKCGNATGWYMGTDGSHNVPHCGITGAICCDATQLASAPPNPCPSQNGICTSFDTALGTIDVSGISGIIQTLFGIMLSFAGGIAVLLIIYSGYRIMTAQGDQEKIKEGREMLTSAVIGLLFVIFSLTILQIIGVDILHLPGFSK